jgi:hypothetical protein
LDPPPAVAPAIGACAHARELITVAAPTMTPAAAVIIRRRRGD